MTGDYYNSKPGIKAVDKTIAIQRPAMAEITVGLAKVASNGIRYCRVIVKDNGSGIPDDLKEKLLSGLCRPFGRTSSKGLGLCLVKSLVDRFHGNVRVEDRVPGDYKNGARFVVMLTAADK
jgi:nitrogen-specific signal transduction histidine kinase